MIDSTSPTPAEGEDVPVIAVDGPSGTGKGTISLRLARRLGWHLLDSGALYRLVALAALRRGLPLDDEPALATLAASLPTRFEPSAGGEIRVFLDEDDVSDELRTEASGNAASKVAVLPAVRSALLARQRAFRTPPGLVADGRDMGTVVFPAAMVKIFLTASPEARAERRYKQLKEKGLSANLAHLLKDIAERDERDASRSVAPLRPATDAVVLDTTGLGIEEVTERAMDLVRARLKLA